MPNVQILYSTKTLYSPAGPRFVFAYRREAGWVFQLNSTASTLFILCLILKILRVYNSNVGFFLYKLFFFACAHNNNKSLLLSIVIVHYCIRQINKILSNVHLTASGRTVSLFFCFLCVSFLLNVYVSLDASHVSRTLAEHFIQPVIHL